MSRFARSARPSAPLEALLRQRLPLPALLHLQWEARRFTRYDLLVRTFAAQSLLRQREDEPLEWYLQMQQRRAGRDTLEDFRRLVASVTARGLDPDYPVGVSRRGELLDGAHRVAVALAIEAVDIAVDPRGSKRPRPYGREWFSANGFSAETLRKLDCELDRLMVTTGAEAFLITQADPEQAKHWLAPHLPSDTELVSHAVVSLDEQAANALEHSARFIALHQKDTPDEAATALRAGNWGVWRLRTHRPRFARLAKSATALSGSQLTLERNLSSVLGSGAFLVTHSHIQQRLVAATLAAAGWDHLEGTPWH